jgi:hypothetical protein
MPSCRRMRGCIFHNTPPPPHPLFRYGTSILQGGVTFKAANIFTNAISRSLGLQIGNFGFSGNGQMEISVVEFLATIPTSAFIVDCNRNMDGPTIAQRAVPLVQYYRNQTGHATTPIVLVEGTAVGYEWCTPDMLAEAVAADQALAAAYQQLVAAGDLNVYYVSYGQLYTPESILDSPTSRGLHPTDEGMRNVASFYEGFLPALLGGLAEQTAG